MIRGELWRWWSVYQGTRHSVSWSGVISGGDGVYIQELDNLYHDQGCSMEVMECVSRNKTLCIKIRGDVWRWWSVYPGTRHSVSWSKVFYGGDGVCIQEQDTLYHDQRCSMEVMECVSRNKTLCIMIKGVLWRWWSVYPGTRHSVSWSKVFYGGDGVCIQEQDTLYHDQKCSMEVMECVSRN